MTSSIQEQVNGACNTNVIINMFYKHRLQKIEEMILAWKGSDAWHKDDENECLYNLNAIRSILLKEIED